MRARQGLPLHVWVDETRPRNQGAALTAWELGQQAVPHTVIPDNTGGHLMQHGMVDLAIVGADRVTAVGDVCNKIGTYLKALPPATTACRSRGAAVAQHRLHSLRRPRRDPDRAALRRRGCNRHRRHADGRIESVRVVPAGSEVANYGFDVTPARLVTGLITERGVVAPEREALARTFSERAAAAE